MFRETSIRQGLWVITIRDANVTGLTTIRAIVESIHAEADSLLGLAEAAIFLAGTLPLRLIALCTWYRHAGNPLAAPAA